MHQDIKQIATHMKEFGLNILGRAIYDVTFSEMTRPFAHALAVVHAAHGAEIILKARIAEEHPLLMFSKLPAPTPNPKKLTLIDLLEHGKSYNYFELPRLVWAITGYKLPHPDRFQAFGKLRNQIVHFAVPKNDLPRETLRFCIEVMEPILNDFWKESAIPYAEVWDETIVSDGYLQEQITENKIKTPGCIKEFLQKR